MGRIVQLVQHAPAPVGIRPRGNGPWYLASGVTPIAAYQPKGAASLAASYVNLINPGTFNAAPGVAPTFATATGWSFDGATQYLTTSGLVVNDTWTLLCEYDLVSAGAPFGVADTGVSTAYLVYPAAGGGTRVDTYSGSLTQATNATQHLSGNYGFAGHSAYRNGVLEPVVVPAGSVVTPLQIFIGAQSLDGVAIAFCQGFIEAFIAFNSILTTPQVAAQAAAMAAL